MRQVCLDKVEDAEIAARLAHLTALAEEPHHRSGPRTCIGQSVDILIESVDGDAVEGRADHQAPEVDGSVDAARLVGGRGRLDRLGAGRWIWTARSTLVAELR